MFLCCTVQYWPTEEKIILESDPNSIMKRKEGRRRRSSLEGKGHYGKEHRVLRNWNSNMMGGETERIVQMMVKMENGD